MWERTKKSTKNILKMKGKIRLKELEDLLEYKDSYIKELKETIEDKEYRTKFYIKKAKMYLDKYQISQSEREVLINEYELILDKYKALLIKHKALLIKNIEKHEEEEESDYYQSDIWEMIILTDGTIVPMPKTTKR